VPLTRMNVRRIFYWSGVLVILCQIILKAFDSWLQVTWQRKLLQGGPMAFFWAGIVAASIGAFALLSVATHFAFSRVRHRTRSVSALVGFFLPHLFLCAVLLGARVVLESPSVLSQLAQVGIAFLGDFLFYVSLTWFLFVLIHSLLPPKGFTVEDLKTH